MKRNPVELENLYLAANRSAGELFRTLSYTMPLPEDYEGDPSGYLTATRDYEERLTMVRRIQNEMSHLAMKVKA